MGLSGGNGASGRVMSCGFLAPIAIESGSCPLRPGGSGNSSCARSQPASAPLIAEGISAGRAGRVTRQEPGCSTALPATVRQPAPSQYAQLMGQFTHCQVSGEAKVNVTSLGPGWVSIGSHAKYS